MVSSDPPAQIGEPYDIGGTRYVPADLVDYDDVGYASWSGEGRAGQSTSIGEPFAADAVTASHKTLPVPSYVEVTALESGRTILVRVNDRGPMDNGRLIDLSAGAAAQLGIQRDGLSAVRVRRVNPPEAERAALRAGGRVPERLPTPEALLAVLRSKASGLPTAPVTASIPSAPPVAAVSAEPATSKPAPAKPAAEKAAAAPAARPADRFIVEGAGAAKPAATKPTPPKAAAGKPAAAAKPAPAKPAAPVASASGSYFVQVSAFSAEARATSIAKATGGSVSKAGSVWRVRMGPYKDEAATQKALAGVRAKGYADARILRDK